MVNSNKSILLQKKANIQSGLYRINKYWRITQIIENYKLVFKLNKKLNKFYLQSLKIYYNGIERKFEIFKQGGNKCILLYLLNKFRKQVM